MRYLLIFVLILFSSLFATQYNVGTSGTKESGASTPDDWTNANLYGTIQAAIAEMSAGDTVYVDDGTYNLTDGNYINYDKEAVPNGTGLSDFTLIAARNTLDVRIEKGGDLLYYDYFVRLNGSYVHIDGFLYVLIDDSTPTSMFSLSGTYNKITNCIAIRKGAMDNYANCFSIDDYFNLIEDCAAAGHGRYLFYTGGSSDDDSCNVFRRCVARFDYSDSNQPMASFAHYGNNGGTNTHKISWQNCIAIDGHRANNGYGTYAYVWGGWYLPKNAYDDYFYGCISLNNDVQYGGFTPIEGSGGRLHMYDCISWANYTGAGGAEGINFRGSGDSIIIDHCTIGSNAEIFQMGNSGTASTRILMNCLFWNNEGSGTIGTWSGGNENHAFNPIGQAFGSAYVIADSLAYITEIPSVSNMYQAGNDGKNIGARLDKRYGVSGTFWGQENWNTLTETALWPFPNQDDIRTAFRETNDPNPGSVPTTNDTERGFCAEGETLTDYILNYLGNEYVQEEEEEVISEKKSDCVNVTEDSN